MKRFLAILLVTLFLGLVPAAQAEAKVFKNCSDLRKTYKNGISLSKSAVNRGVGPIFTPRVSAAIFRMNSRLDIDRDNIVCEVVRPKPRPAAVAPAPSPSPSEPPKDLSIDPSITKDFDLTNIEVCKTSDLSPRPGASNGFPRPAGALTGSVSARILYVPIVFRDLAFTDSDLGRIKTATDKVSQFYETTSYGKVKISYEFLPKQDWIMMTKSAADYRLPENIPQKSNLEVVEDALALASSSVNFGLYDGIVLTTGFSTTIRAGVAYTGMTFKTSNGIARGVSLEVGSSTGQIETMAHELGHSLFGLEDLYVFLNPTRPSVPDPQPAGPWDMMSSSSLEFFGWNKLLMGWLDSNHVRCITGQSLSTHYIETIDSRGSQPKIVLINLSDGITLAIEGRALPSRGVLIYKIDTRIQHGDGPIVAEKVLLTPGSKLTRDSWTIRVGDFDSKGFLVEVTRG